jgi:hypothetical protein
MFIAWLLLAAPVVAAALFWGSWGWFAVAVGIAVVEFLSFRRTEQFSARIWRAVGHGRRSRTARGAETLYLFCAGAGFVLLAVSLLGP